MQIGQENAKINRMESRINFFNAWCGVSEDGYKSSPTDNNAQAIRLPFYDYPRMEKELDACKVEILHMHFT